MATATGLAGMSGYLGATIFTLVFGVLVTLVGYSPLFMLLAVFDLVAAAVVCLLIREKMAPGVPLAKPAFST